MFGIDTRGACVQIAAYAVLPGGVKRLQINERVVVKDLRVVTRNKAQAANIRVKGIDVIDAIGSLEAIFPPPQVEKFELVRRGFSEFRQFNTDSANPIAFFL